MPNKKPWLAICKDGFKELVASRPAWYAVAELCQNCWDEDGTTKVTITLEKLPGRPAARLVVEDDSPEGFRDLTHAYTLFARSEKRDNPEKRGFINLGEKVVLARCIEAEISSTTGTIVFNEDGTRSHRRKKREVGTVFSGIIRMNQKEYDEACDAVWMLNPPEHIPTTFNGTLLDPREVIASFTAPLQTRVTDEEGNMKMTVRKTAVHIYAVEEDESAHIYEMGIPVVETGDAFHVDVQQKVPVNMDRDNVPPAYLRKLRALVLNHTADMLDEDDASEKWVDMALEDKDIEDEAVKRVVETRFGKKVVAADPSDPEANSRAMAEGYTVVHGRSLSSKQWENVKRAEAFKPAGQVFPTRDVEYSADGTPEEVLEQDDWNDDHWTVSQLAKSIANVLGFSIKVRMVLDKRRFGTADAWYGSRVLHFNYRRLGKKWFKDEKRQGHIRLIIHELAHEYEMNHLSEDYHMACCRIGAKVALAVAAGELTL